MKQLSLVIAFVTACLTGAVFAQPVPAGRTLSLSHAIHAVDDLDTTLAFYRDIFAIDGNVMDFDNPAVPLLTNAPGVTLRLSMAALPGGTRFEFTEFRGLERRPVRAAYTDPGAASLVLFVRDIDALVSTAKSANAEIVTAGGVPVEIAAANGKVRSIIFRDPDGFFLQLIEQNPPAGAPGANVYRASLAYTIEEMEATRRFYTGMMGIELAGSSGFVKDPALNALVGAPEDAEFRRLSGMLPPNVEVTFTEFRGLPRTRVHPRVRDPGAPAMALQVSNIEGMVGQMKASGVNIISTGGELVDFGNGIRNIFVEDPNGMNLELFERQ